MIPDIPLSGTFIDSNGGLSRSAVEFLNLLRLTADTVTQSGTTAQRPTKALWVGRPFYDLTLNKPIWVNAVTPSVVWKDAAGTTV
jgi:hypothetical protein